MRGVQGTMIATIDLPAKVSREPPSNPSLETTQQSFLRVDSVSTADAVRRASREGRTKCCEFVEQGWIGDNIIGMDLCPVICKALRNDGRPKTGR